MNFSDYKKFVQEAKRDKPFFLQRFGYLIHREISAPISYAFAKFTPFVTPNMISLLMLAWGIVGCALIFFGNYNVVMFGIVLVYISFILDKVDGELARFKNMHSLRGMYLDEWYHSLIPQLFVVAFFAKYAHSHSFLLVLLLMLILFLGLFRRYERKWYMIIATKKAKMIESGVLLPPLQNTLVRVIGDNYVFRISSVVERFDILMLACLVSLVFSNYYGVTVNLYLLICYGFFSLVYTVRWALLNYFGNLDKNSENLIKNGF